MKLFLILALGLLGACTKPAGCVLQDQAATIATSVIVSNLACTNSDAVRSSVIDVISQSGICSDKMQVGLIADTFCPLLVSQLQSLIATKVIPPEWGCDAQSATGDVASALLAACKKIPVSAGK